MEEGGIWFDFDLILILVFILSLRSCSHLYILIITKHCT